MKVLTVIGARPQFVKAATVNAALAQERQHGALERIVRAATSARPGRAIHEYGEGNAAGKVLALLSALPASS